MPVGRTPVVLTSYASLVYDISEKIITKPCMYRFSSTITPYSFKDILLLVQAARHAYIGYAPMLGIYSALFEK